MWSQWEEDSAWSDNLLTTFHTSFPNMHQEGDSEEQIAKNLSVYQVRGAFLCFRGDEQLTRAPAFLLHPGRCSRAHR